MLFFFSFCATANSAQGLLLAPFSRNTSGSVQRAMRDAGDQRQVNCVQERHSTHCIMVPASEYAHIFIESIYDFKKMKLMILHNPFLEVVTSRKKTGPISPLSIGNSVN